jgi:rhomboid protease GluP
MAKHSFLLPLNNKDFTAYLAIAVKACAELGWTVTFVSESGLQAESPFSMMKNTYGEEITLRKQGDQIEYKSVSKGSTMIDFGRNKKNLQLLVDKITALESVSPDSELESIRVTIVQQQATGEDDLLNPSSKAARDSQWWNLFIPKEGFFITPILIICNILLFIAMVIASGSFETLLLPSTDTLLDWGANYRPNTLGGQWWRLLTCVFEHIGIIHLIMNMYALLYVGILLEPILGKIRFLASYLATGIAASLVSLWWHENTVSAGASGAIFGMYGLFLSLLLTNIIDKETRKALLPSIGIFIGYNLLFGLRSGVDNAAHIGGLVSGFLAGLLLYYSLRKPGDKKTEWVSSLAILVCVVVATNLVLPRIKNPIGEYVKLMNEFSEQETAALEVYTLSDTTSNETISYKLKNASVPALEKCAMLLKKAEVIDLPDELKPRILLLKKYIDLRTQEANLRVRAIEENSDQYNEEINSLVKQISEQIKQLEK